MENHADDPIKQIIVVRRKFPDGKGGVKAVRTGKMIAQAAHASMAFLSQIVCKSHFHNTGVELTLEQKGWIYGKFTKVAVYVETEEELLHVYNIALDNELTTHLIEDSGLTEFHGDKTMTALAIGPHYSSKLNPVTGHLPLL